MTDQRDTPDTRTPSAETRCVETGQALRGMRCAMVDGWRHVHYPVPLDAPPPGQGSDAPSAEGCDHKYHVGFGDTRRGRRGFGGPFEPCPVQGSDAPSPNRAPTDVDRAIPLTPTAEETPSTSRAGARALLSPPGSSPRPRGAQSGTTKAGWCLDGHHKDCPSTRCTCPCHGVRNGVRHA